MAKPTRCVRSWPWAIPGVAYTHARKAAPLTLAHGLRPQVLRSNMYSLEQGEPSVLDREAKPSTPVVRSRQMAGKDYPHSEVCQVCWEKEDYWLEEFGAKKSTFLLCRCVTPRL
jgi:hypothetical protein